MGERAMASRKSDDEMLVAASSSGILDRLPLWQLDIVEVAGHNLEARGRDEVNRLLAAGWRLLHIYTLRYQEDGMWRERPMAILGRPRNDQGQNSVLNSNEQPATESCGA